jgi:hypothetical protein
MVLNESAHEADFSAGSKIDVSGRVSLSIELGRSLEQSFVQAD